MATATPKGFERTMANSSLPCFGGTLIYLFLRIALDFFLRLPFSLNLLNITPMFFVICNHLLSYRQWDRFRIVAAVVSAAGNSHALYWSMETSSLKIM